ncbi:MAG: type II toxin-antitoxin system VapC family toxin [Candidatus Thiosymbion ectosymbiont of Robbea hypermnestra]|nr:type II toxin-antitoxin system VapC family toxin [Candidatus Thiosymbion ectosymbiont of Robbea hypermnestra]
MILCDTNILIEFYKNTPEIIGELCEIGQHQLAVSAITQAELYFGALDKSELQKIKRHLSLVFVIPVDNHISKQFISLMEKYSLSHKLSIPDALIASTALVHQQELYTLNDKDFRFISGLRLYNPKM